MSSLEGQVMDYSTHSVFVSNKGFHEDGMLEMVSLVYSLYVLSKEFQEISTHQTFIEHLLCVCKCA